MRPSDSFEAATPRNPPRKQCTTCGAATTSGKPKCEKHILEMPYVMSMVKDTVEQDIVALMTTRASTTVSRACIDLGTTKARLLAACKKLGIEVTNEPNRRNREILMLRRVGT